MVSNLELYGTEDVPEVPQDIVCRRLELLEDRLSDLLEVHYTLRDLEAVSMVRKAILHWQQINDM